MVISSGMQSMDTMKQVYQIVKPLNPNFCFLQCTSAYPLQPEDTNLRVITVSSGEGTFSSGCGMMAFYCAECREDRAFYRTRILTNRGILLILTSSDSLAVAESD